MLNETSVIKSLLAGVALGQVDATMIVYTLCKQFGANRSDHARAVFCIVFRGIQAPVRFYRRSAWTLDSIPAVHCAGAAG